jgi:hypothetical protein
MRILTMYRRLDPSTVTGEQIVVVITYSSFNKEEIDALEKELKKTIGSGVISESEEKA